MSTSTSASGEPPTAMVTRPLMRPPTASAKLMLVVVVPAVTGIGVPSQALQYPAHEVPSCRTSMIHDEFYARSYDVPPGRAEAVQQPDALVLPDALPCSSPL